MDTMLAAVYRGPEDIRIDEVQIPVIGPGEVLVRVASAGICGTDLRMLKGTHLNVPPGVVLIFGHENSGTIAKLGEGIEGYQIGQKVFVAPNIGCGKCNHCVTGNNNICTEVVQIGMSINGGFAEYLRVPARAVQQGNLLPVGAEIDFSVASLTEPLACVIRGQEPLQICPGKIVLIMGAGQIGTLHMKLAKLKGSARVIVSEPDLYRREHAAQFGADRVVNPHTENLVQVIQDESEGRGADAIVVAVSSAQAQETSLELAAIGGRICFFGGLPKGRSIIPLDSNLIHYKELIVTGSSGNSTANCREALAIIKSGQIDLSCIVTSRYPLAEIHSAFDKASKPDSLKVAVLP
jgi:L-iditol 2-dehydrogenase